MAQIIQPSHVLLAALASWINRHQQAAIHEKLLASGGHDAITDDADLIH